MPDAESRLLEHLGRQLDLVPPATWWKDLRSLHALLVEANERANLTRITSWEDFLFKHVADSLLAAAAWPRLRAEDLRVVDVGCGGGVPGLPLALTFPRLRVTELDSRRRKVEAVEGFIAALLPGRGAAVHGRARERAREPGFRGAFDVVLARAVGPTPELVRECRRFLAPGGALISYKTPAQVEEERGRLDREARKAGLVPTTSEIFALPGERGERQLWIIS